MAMKKKEAYEVLGLDKNSTQTDIEKTYAHKALMWFPEKQGNKKAVVEQFTKINQAYRTLTLPEAESKKPITLKEMYLQFQDVLFGKVVSDIEDSDFTTDDEMTYSDSSNGDSFLKDCLTQMKLTDEVRMQNAEKLIAEEEKEKKKAEKRKAKKKRRREKKKTEKAQKKEESTSTTAATKKESPEKKKSLTPTPGNASDSSGEEELDPTSAFVAAAVDKAKINVSKSDKAQDEKEKALLTLEPKVIQSRQLAIQGNEMARAENYKEAINFFTEAIKLDPQDFRFYGNRSYCYTCLEQYERALKDAERAIKLSPQWPKGYFRKGKALAGLQRYRDAFNAFEEVLKFDKECEEAEQEIFIVKTMQLMEMGVSQYQAEQALKKYNSVQEALEAVLQGEISQAPSESEDSDIYISDDDDALLFSQSKPSVPVDNKMDPRNPNGCLSLWVGNVKPEVTEKVLQNLFGKYGEVISVRLLVDKHCAFVNYRTKEAAGRAMEHLQGKEVQGLKLLIKFPDNVRTPGSNLILKKPKSSTDKSDDKSREPVNGDECYYWRTTGCIYGSDCRYKHIPGNKGKDKK